MYSLDSIKRAARDPARVIREANRFLHTRGFRHQFNPRGTAVLDEDWDNLIILDACRYDYFAEQADLPGRLDSRESLGAATYQFIRANFSDRVLHDTVYVMDNAWYLQLKDEIGTEVHAHYNLHGGGYDVEFADEELDVVAPHEMTRFARRAANEYPEKRLIVHYLQPHHPFLGETGQRLEQTSSSLLEVLDDNDHCTVELLREAYRENLDIALAEVEQLLPDLEGRTVVTADHGEMLGDRHRYLPMRDYGHHPGIFNDATVKIPWLVVDSGERRTIRSEEPADTEESVDHDAVEDRLEQLGYKM
jgi:hypothetical protein